VTNTCNPGTQEVKQEDQEFKASLAYIVSLVKKVIIDK
jgi:hypothetical protein